VARHYEDRYTAADGLQIFAQGWRPAGQPRGLVCLVHGLGEHSGRYAHVAEHLCAGGYILAAADLRGHGRSAGPRGHAPTFDLVMDDIGLLLAEAARRFPGLPVVLYGQSLGGNLVLNYALLRKPDLAGVIATSPALRPAFEPPAWKLALGRGVCNFVPGLAMSNELELEAISRDAEVVSRYRADPLTHDRVSARLGIDIIETGEWALAHAAEFPLPLLLMHGDADRITSAGATRQFAAEAGPACTLKIWEGCYHEVHNDPGHEAFLAYLTAWLDGICTR
jgi:alpha-beta hydrolase superfamily lysophospholipase